MTTGLRRTAVRLDRTLPSTLEQVDAVCREIRAFLHEHGAGTAAFVVELVGRESLNNAVIHGNRRDGQKTVHLGLRLDSTHVRLSVADEGQGFDWRRGLAAPTPGEYATNGRGLPILTLYADRVRYNAQGNRLTVWIPRRPREE